MAKRVVRMESQKELEAGAAVRKTTNVADLMALLETEKAAVVALGITDESLDLLIDHGAVRDALRKQYEKEAKLIKAVLLEHAKRHHWKTRVASKASVNIKPSTSSEIKPTDMLKKLVALGKRTLFDSVFKVQKTQADELLGKPEVADIAVTKTEEYGTVSLKVK